VNPATPLAANFLLILACHTVLNPQAMGFFREVTSVRNSRESQLEKGKFSAKNSIIGGHHDRYSLR
jgi:hypothetical protein